MADQLTRRLEWTEEAIEHVKANLTAHPYITESFYEQNQHVPSTAYRCAICRKSGWGVRDIRHEAWCPLVQDGAR